MSRKLILMLLFITCSIHAMAQMDYYYNSYGTKIPLPLNENKVLVSVPIDCNLVMERIRANVQAIYKTGTADFYKFYITREDLEKLSSQDFWEEDAKSVIITPCYYRDDDRGEFYREIYLTPYMLVTLKKEDDIVLLTSYVEKYKLRIASDFSSDPMMGLLYILHVTLESEKSPLECANEIHETGLFASSRPDFALAGDGAYEPNTIRSITTAMTEKLSDIYDLSGRKVQGTPKKGVYIQNGKKVVIK